MKHYAILSLFDGISCGQIAFNKILPKNAMYTYYSAEINQTAINVTLHNFPETIILGDIRNVKKNIIPYDIFMIIGGSPCQDLSIAGKRKGMTTKNDIEITSLEQYLKLKKNNYEFIGQSYLFWEFIRILKEFNPKYYLLENVKMNSKWENVISNTLGTKPISINSSLVSAQNRERLYWTNIPNVLPPKDKNIKLSDLIKGAKGCGIRGVKNYHGWYDGVFTIRKDDKSNCVVTSRGNTQKIILPNGHIRHIEPHEAELLQTIPVGYTNIPGITKSRQHEVIGNGWTVDVIHHIFSHIPELKKSS